MTGLEALNKIDNEVLYGVYAQEHYSNELATIRKELQALEIIKEKNVNVYWFKSELTLRNISYRYYVNNFGSFHNGLVVKLLDEEEFDILKEVLEQ